MDTIETMQDYETSNNANHKAQLLKALMEEDSKFVKSLGNPYVKHARRLARQGVIKLPKGFQSYDVRNRPGVRLGASVWHCRGLHWKLEREKKESNMNTTIWRIDATDKKTGKRITCFHWRGDGQAGIAHAKKEAAERVRELSAWTATNIDHLVIND